MARFFYTILSTTDLNWHKTYIHSVTDFVLRFYFPLDANYVISDTFVPANLLAYYWRN